MIILDALMQNKCPYCGKPLKHGMTECNSCRADFPEAPKKTVISCGDLCIAPFVYRDRAAKALKDLKFRSIVFNSRSLGCAMAEALSHEYPRGTGADIIISVPMTKARRKKRGFNQSELLASELSKQTGIPFEKLLIRVVESEHQHSLSLEERKKHSKDYYRVTDNSRVKGKSILLVDDIITSGSTLSSCSQSLKDAGAKSILCVVAAMTIIS